MRKVGGQWIVPGENGSPVAVTFEDIYLVEMVHVGKGSWQPVLAYLV